MADACRDWLKTLWPASYRGFAFYFESDDESGGRGLVIHKFPNRDEPYIEDLGEEPRFYDGVAYVHGESADRLAVEFSENLSARGPATLVVPIRGPVLVHSQQWERHHEKNKLGYVAFRVKFVRDGAATALISVPHLLHLAFGAANDLASSIAQSLPLSLDLKGAPDFVADAAADGFGSFVAAVDGVRESYALAPDLSAALRDELADIVADADAAIDRDAKPADIVAIAQRAIEATRKIADGIAPLSAVRAMAELIEAFAAPVVTGIAPAYSITRARNNAAAMARFARLVAVTSYAEAVLRASYASRSDGVAARAQVAARFDQEMADTTGADNAALFAALSLLQGRVIDYLQALINDLAPVIGIEAARQMPSIFWAYRLYRDPLRGAEIAARNGVRHPAFMPREFSALAF